MPASGRRVGRRIARASASTRREATPGCVGDRQERSRRNPRAPAAPAHFTASGGVAVKSGLGILVTLSPGPTRSRHRRARGWRTWAGICDDIRMNRGEPATGRTRSSRPSPPGPQVGEVLPVHPGARSAARSGSPTPLVGRPGGPGADRPPPPGGRRGPATGCSTLARSTRASARSLGRRPERSPRAKAAATGRARRPAILRGAPTYSDIGREAVERLIDLGREVGGAPREPADRPRGGSASREARGRCRTPRELLAIAGPGARGAGRDGGEQPADAAGVGRGAGRRRDAPVGDSEMEAILGVLKGGDDERRRSNARRSRAGRTRRRSARREPAARGASLVFVARGGTRPRDRRASLRRVTRSSPRARVSSDPADSALPSRRRRAPRVEATPRRDPASGPAARPARIGRSMPPASGTTSSSARVYGCIGRVRTSSAGPISTIRPRYITATRSAIVHASPRSWVTMRIEIRILVAQLHQQPQDLAADRRVEVRHRLVGDDDLGLERERAGDHHALALTAGQLVRVRAGRSARAAASPRGRAHARRAAPRSRRRPA